MKKFKKITSGMARIKNVLSQSKRKVYAFLWTMMVYAYMAPPSIVSAATGDGTDIWNTAMDLIQTYVTKAGLIMIVTGVVMYAMGHREDDARLKSIGTNTMVAGLMVAGICQTLVPKLKM